MKKIAILSLLAMACFAANASTTITTSNVSGHWTATGSPYIIKANISVVAGQTLTIDPGVEVIFDSVYQFSVMGNIYAVGTAASPISFHVADTTGWYEHSTLAGGWMGIYLYPSGLTTEFSHCKISDTKFRAIGFNKRNLTLTDCEFFHNNYFNNGTNISGALDSAGVYLFTMDHCSVHDNKATAVVGVGLGRVDIHDCSIYNNSSVMYTLSVSNCKANIFNNILHDNTTSYTIVMVDRSQASIRHNVIHHNASGEQAPVSLVESNNTDINGNLIVNNQSTHGDDGGSTCAMVQGGGGVRVMGAVDSTFKFRYLIRNNVIANNNAAYAGGGIYVYDASATIVNNTLTNNSSAMGGGIYIFNNPAVFSHSLVKIKNNIFHNNRDIGRYANVYMCATDSVQYEYNCTQNGLSADVFAYAAFAHDVLIADSLTNVIFSASVGPGLINEPADGADALVGDFRLLSTSIAINKGDTTGAYADSTDFENQQRIYGPKIDIGACESSPAELAHTGIGTIEAAIPKMSLYPNPANGVCSVHLPALSGSLELLDCSGRTVFLRHVTSDTESLDVRSLADGVYFVVWSNDKGLKLTQNLVIAR